MLTTTVLLTTIDNAYASSCSGFTNTELPTMNVACGGGNTAGDAGGSIYNVALGEGNFAERGWSTAVGSLNEAMTARSSAIGTENIVYGSSATAVGSSNRVGIQGIRATGNGSSAFGVLNNIQTGNTGEDSGYYSTAIGALNNVAGVKSTALGYYNYIGRIQDCLVRAFITTTP